MEFANHLTFLVASLYLLKMFSNTQSLLFPQAHSVAPPGATKKHRRLTNLTPGIRLAICILIITVPGCKGEKTNDLSRRDLSVSHFEEQKITAFCGDCHAMPPAESFPKRAWHDEVKRGYAFYYASERTDLDIPVQDVTLRYFTNRAPENLPIRPASGISNEWVDKFDRSEISIPEINSPAVSFVDFIDLGVGFGKGLLISDMRGGGIYFAAYTENEFASPIRLGQVKNPSALRVLDWDNDGFLDILAADLGSFLPADHQDGRVVWLRQNSDQSKTFEPIILLEGLGRVASLELGDLNDDGRVDLLVAEFGWQSTGSVFWIARQDNPTEMSIKHLLDKRSGAIHTPIIDLNGDNKLDIVALISQHHECIDAFINKGNGRFDKETIFVAPDPAYGSSGIELVDMNQDGKIDILYTNGDSFDSFFLKPSHGVRWFENTGRFPFTEHRLGEMPGAHRALAVDIDLDGRNEVISGAFLPRKLLRTHAVNEAEGLVLWKRDDAGNYHRHVLVQSETSYAALCIAETTPALPPLIVVGHFREDDTGAAITVWRPK
jgi:hypothetical protein